VQVTSIHADMSVEDAISVLRHEIAERQAIIDMLKHLCSNGQLRGRPRKYSSDAERQVCELIANGASHREIARTMMMPVGSVGKIARRCDAKRLVGDRRGGPRVKGSVTPNRKHQKTSA
jgi:hypothetical protein